MGRSIPPKHVTIRDDGRCPPSPEDFNLNPNVYEDYFHEREALENEIGKIKKKIAERAPIGAYLFFLGLVVSLVVLGVTENGWFVVAGFSISFFIGDWVEEKGNKGDKGDLKRLYLELGKLWDAVCNKVRDFELAYYNFYKMELEEYFKRNIFRKRSNTKTFEGSLRTFKSMLERAERDTQFINTFQESWMELSWWDYRQYFGPDYKFPQSIPWGGAYWGNYRRYLAERESRSASSSEGGSISNNSVSQPQPQPIPSDSKGDPAPSGRQAVQVIPANPVPPRIIPSYPPKENPVPPEMQFRSPRKINWEDLVKDRIRTGLFGEEIVVALEKEYLRSIGKSDLAEKVRHVSREDGDGLGYDVLSCFPSGFNKYIEVKTTSKTLVTPFFMTSNEIEFLKKFRSRAFIYRIALNEDGTGEVQLHAEVGADYLNKNRVIPVTYSVDPLFMPPSSIHFSRF